MPVQIVVREWQSTWEGRLKVQIEMESDSRNPVDDGQERQEADVVSLTASGGAQEDGLQVPEVIFSQPQKPLWVFLDSVCLDCVWLLSMDGQARRYFQFVVLLKECLMIYLPAYCGDQVGGREPPFQAN